MTKIPKQLLPLNFVLVGKDKKPFQKGWQKKILKSDNPELVSHLTKNKNYGVQGNNSIIYIGGIPYFLIVVDFDKKEFMDKVFKKFPETFTTTSGSSKNCVHIWLASDSNKSYKILDEKLETLCDVQGEGKQVISPGSKHQEGSIYSVVKDLPIAFMPYAEIEAILTPYDKRPKKIKPAKKQYSPKGIGNDITEKIINSVSMVDVLNEIEIDTTKNPTNCFAHSSEGGKCFGWNDETAHCFHCDGSWNKFSLIRDSKNLTDKRTFEWFAEKGGVTEELEQSRKEYKNNNKMERNGFSKDSNIFTRIDTPKKDLIKQMERFENNQKKIDREKKEDKERNKVKILLPQQSQSFTEFVDEIVVEINKNGIELFNRPRYHTIVENTSWYDKVLDQQVDGLREVKIIRLINVLEEKFKFYSIVKTSEELFTNSYKELSKKWAELLMENTEFLESLPKVDRVFTCALPYKINGKLVLPKEGWDERLDSFLIKDSPKIELIDVKDAKKIIKKTYKEFCFKQERDREFAIAHLLTPGCRGMYSEPTARTPLFIYEANRERCGKDYCAGIVSIVYEGHVNDNPPISNNERNSSGGSDELRKKLTSAIKRGARILHFANNRGRLNNVVLEQALTSEHWNDRLLGKNTEVSLNNEIDFSISANMGLSYTSDLDKRSRKIELFYAPEDINKRTFKNPNLHGWVKKNRNNILSAIYTLIQTWHDAGEPSDSIHTSFHEWARVVGGVMKYHNLGDPCITVEDYDAIGGDTETRDMRDLFIYMYDLNSKGQTDLNKVITNSYNMSEIMEHVKNGQNEGESFFSYYDLDSIGGKVKFSFKLRKFLDREFSNIKFEIFEKKERTSRETYIFREIEVGKAGKAGNPWQVQASVETIKKENIYGGGETLPILTRVTKSSIKKEEKTEKTEKIGKFDVLIPDGKEIEIKELYSAGITPKEIEKAKENGEIFEPKQGFVKRL